MAWIIQNRPCKGAQYTYLNILTYQNSIKTESNNAPPILKNESAFPSYQARHSLPHEGPTRSLPRGPLQNSTGVSRQDDIVMVGGACQGNSGYIKI